MLQESVDICFRELLKFPLQICLCCLQVTESTEITTLFTFRATQDICSCHMGQQCLSSVGLQGERESKL